MSREPNMCPACGYILRNARVRACSSCAAAVPKEIVRATNMRRGPRWWMVAAGFASSTLLLLMLLGIVWIVYSSYDETRRMRDDSSYWVGLLGTCGATLGAVVMILARRRFAHVPLALRWILLAISWATPVLLILWIAAQIALR